MMKQSAIAGLVGSLLLGACSTVGTAPDSAIATVNLQTADGSPVGKATLRARGSDLLLRVDVTGVAPGEHGLHLHAVGKCEGPKFATATGHLNPSAKLHGTLNPQGSHLGDLPNILIKADGSGTVQATLTGTRDQVEPQIFDADGTALIIHAVADDYRTDPSGNSGDRIVCGVFTRGG